MKTKKLSTLERYTAVAVRAKISVEVEQRKRLGAWGKRVLVLDGATLYAYKAKGDGGSVGGWAIGGADVHVRRNGDSNKEDGRHILVIARPPVYKLVFAFSTVYEQARMIQALSSSGATVTGLDAIMLLKNLRQQQEQEQEQKEQEERQRTQNVQASQEASKKETQSVKTTKESNDSMVNIGNQSIEKEVEVKEIDESIYDYGTGTVSNPLYASNADLSTERSIEDKTEGFKSPSARTSISTCKDSAAYPFQEVSGNQDPEDKVNPLPKPPRASVSEGSPTNDASVPDSGDRGTNINNSETALDKQSVLSSGEVHGDLHTASEEGSEEGEGHYEFSHDHQDGNHHNGLLSDKEEEEEESVQEEWNFENNYVELVSKMKLERGLSIEYQSGAPILDAASPEGVRKILGDSPLSDDVSLKSPSPVNEIRSDKHLTKGEHSDSVGKYHANSKLGSDEALSDYDEKFEQLYRELSSYGNTDVASNSEKTDDKNTIEKNGELQNSNKITRGDHLDTSQKHNNPPSDTEDSNTEKTAETSDREHNYSEGTPLKRVSSIIKKKDSPGSGKSKKVQFNLEATTIEAGTPKINQGDASSSMTLTLKKTSDSSSKKRLEESPKSPAVTSPTKKKGIFSNIFSGSTQKKPAEVAPQKTEPSATSQKTNITATPQKTNISAASQKTNISAVTKTSAVPQKTETSERPEKKDTSAVPQKKDAEIKKEPSSAKVEPTIKNAPTTSQTNLKRQPTVDLAAPLIIGGSVEMGGSISGKVSPRRMEVRDGHVLAYMPKATSPTSRLSLVGLSVKPMMGGAHPNTLSLTRANRCMMIIKLTSREEMMRWINVLSDEVIKLTPENHRSNLVLYPSPKKEKSENKSEKLEEKDKEEPLQFSDSKEPKGKSLSKTSQDDLKEKKLKPKLTNGHTEEHADKTIGKRKTEIEKTTQSPTNGEVVSNGMEEEGEDTSDGWFRKKKQPVTEEFEMEEFLKAAVASNDTKKVSTNNSQEVKINMQSNGLNVAEDHFKEDKKSEKTVRKINKLNIQEIWKEQKDIKNTSQKFGSPIHRQSLGNRQHAPLRRLSVQENTIPRAKSEGQDAEGSFLFVNNSPKRDYHANCHPPLERLSNHSRILSASESNLRKGVNQKSASNINHLHRYGSELTLVEKPRNEFNNNMVHGTKDTSNVLVSSSLLRFQGNALKKRNEQGRVNGMSPKSSPSRTSHKRPSSAQPREVEIVNFSKSNSQELHITGIEESNEEDDTLYEDEESEKDDPSQESNPAGITWSVSATREKFELLCSVSGENKGGKLTTKTPISRKKTVRTSIKKRRSLESGSGRRQNSRRNIRRSLQGSKSNDSSSTTNISLTSTPSNLSESSQMISPEKPQGSFKLEPVRDRRKTFEKDVPDSHDSFNLYNSSSVDSVNDTMLINETTSPIKSPLRRTHNILQATDSPSSSPEPGFITSKLINSRPKGNIPEEDKGFVSRSLTTEAQMNAEKDAEVVICWRGPYIAQEAEQAVLSNISNAFLAKRRLLAREVAVARIQEKLSTLEETIWDIQASMAEIDKQSSFANAKATNNWRTLERSLKTAEEDMEYWTSRLVQTQREADQAREKLASALVTGLTQYNPEGEKIPPKQRQRLLKKYTRGQTSDDVEEEEKEEDGNEALDSEENEDSFA